MWSVSEQGFLLVEGERCVNTNGDVLGIIKEISKGKVHGELVVEFNGSKARKLLQAAQYVEQRTPDGIVEEILSIIDKIPVKEVEPEKKKQKKRKRKFLETEVGGDSLRKSQEAEMDESIQKKMKGTMITDVEELSTFNQDFCPRLLKPDWVLRLKELLRRNLTLCPDASLGIIPAIKSEDKIICLGGNHKVKALQEIQASNPDQKIQITIKMYEGLSMEECWRLSNHENEEKAEIKQITFQDKVFQARRLKDQPKMREKLSLIFAENTKKLKADAMGTILSVARYGEGCWGLVEDLMQKFEEKHGVGKSMSQSLFRNLQGCNDQIKTEVLKEAILNGVEKATRMSAELKARHKLQDFFVHKTGAESWSNALEKYPQSAQGVEKFVVPKISRRTMVPEEFVAYTEKCVNKELPAVQIDIQVTVNGKESKHFQDIISSFERKMKDEIEIKLMSNIQQLNDNEQ